MIWSTLLRLILATALAFVHCAPYSRADTTLTLQLNWLHDPSFTGEYLAAKNQPNALRILEGGPNIFPIEKIVSGQAQVAVVGADVFLRAVGDDYRKNQASSLVCIFVDFQRNPVAWVLHPTAVERAGLEQEPHASGRELNALFFEKLRKGTFRVGDKRGTETTSVWLQWKQLHKLPESFPVVPVGFDSSLVLSAPMLAYPVYINEEPYKLEERVGRPLMVLDPADDGIGLYGNVLVTTIYNWDNNREAIVAFQNLLRQSWRQAQDDLGTASEEVSRYYSSVSAATIRKQIHKTLELVCHGDNSPGSMDTEQGGKWEQTLRAVQQTGMVGHDLSFQLLKRHLMAPK